MSDPQVSPQPAVVVSGIPILTDEGQRKAEDLAMEYLGQSVLRDNINNYYMAQKFYIDSMYTAERMGQTVFDAVKNHIAPFPQPNTVINQNFSPPSPPPPSQPVQVAPVVSTGNQPAPTTSGLSGMAKKALTYGAIAAASGGLGVGAPILYNYLTTPKPAVAPVNPAPPDHPDSSLELEVH